MNEFKYAILSNEPTIENIDKEIERLQKMANDYNNMQMAIKIFINSVYGACASVYFSCYNPYLAEAITLQGQDIIKFSAKVLNKYFHEYWPKDTQLHKILNITKIPKVEMDVAVYGDTDTIASNSIITTQKGKISIENLYLNELKNSPIFEISPNGHEVISPTDVKILNYDKNNQINFSSVSKIIRHKSSKEKWKLLTKTGKEIICTLDHSLIVFRNGIKMEIKPCEILKTDKILAITKIIKK